MLFLGLFSSTPCLSADTEITYSTEVSILTLESALLIAQNTIKKCQNEGAQISVTVVDRFGTIQVQLRDTLAAPVSLPISYRKAKTAANFNADTSTLTEMRNGPLSNIENLLMGAGGMPINAGGVFYGAVGVSGSSGKIDQLCATTGARSINEDLELQ